jgi:hypothetical protein
MHLLWMKGTLQLKFRSSRVILFWYPERDRSDHPQPWPFEENGANAARQIRREETMTESYLFLLKMLRKRLPPMLSDQVELDALSMSEMLNLIFALYRLGEVSATLARRSRL